MPVYTPCEWAVYQQRLSWAWAARLSPEELVFVLPELPMIKPGRPVTITLPSFRRARLIELDTRFLRITSPTVGELPALETLSISGNIVDLAALLARCPRLRVLGVTFRRADTNSLDTGLAAVEAAVPGGLAVSRLGIEYDRGFECEQINRKHSIDDTRFASLLRTVARISPHELSFTNNFWGRINADLLCFHQAVSIGMNLSAVCFTQLRDCQFSMLERLCLTDDCSVIELAALVTRCPRLRVLKVTADESAPDITVHSTSLEELDIYRRRKGTTCRGIDIMAPMLNQLNITISGSADLSVSILAPMVEKVAWSCSYKAFIFGFWWLSLLNVETKESYKDTEGVLSNDREDACAPLPHIHVLSLRVNAYERLGVAIDFAHEIEKLPVDKFSVLEININQDGHVYGAFLLRLLGIHHIRTNIQSLKVILEWCETTKAHEYVGYCPCDEPRNWRNQSISLDKLVEVEIDNFRGHAHDMDFLTSIFKWAPILKNLTVRLALRIGDNKLKGCVTDVIYDIFMEHPYVNCSLFRYNTLVSQTSIQPPCS